MDNSIINSNGICNHCNTKSIHYGIKNGNYSYYCNNCNHELYQNEITAEKDILRLSLAYFLTHKNEIVKRNAMSIFKTLQK